MKVSEPRAVLKKRSHSAILNNLAKLEVRNQFDGLHTLSGDKVSPKKGYKLFMGTSI